MKPDSCEPSALCTGAPWNKPGWLQEAAQRLVAAKQLVVEAAIPQLDTAGLPASLGILGSMCRVSDSGLAACHTAHLRACTIALNGSMA